MLAFVHINKTAGTSIKFILRNSFGLRHCDVVTQNRDGIFSADELRFARRIFPGLCSISGHPVQNPAATLPEDVHAFTFVREPISRCASQFQQIARGDRSKRRKYREERAGEPKPSFEEFIHNPQYRDLQVQRIAGRVDLEEAQTQIRKRFLCVGLTERFHESVRILQNLSPYPMDPRFRQLKVAPDNEVKSRLLADPATLRMLTEANEVDLALYEHIRVSVYPEQAKEAEVSWDGFEERVPPIDFNPHRYRLSRMYNNLVYKQALKARSRFS